MVFIMSWVCVCVYVYLRSIGDSIELCADCVGVSSDASNWQPSAQALEHTYTHTNILRLLRLRFQFDFRKFQQQQHLRFCCFRLFQTCSFCYFVYFMFAYVDTHTYILSGTHIHTDTAGAALAAGILRAFCSCAVAAAAAPATRPLQWQTEAAAANNNNNNMHEHAPTVLSLVPIIWDHFEQLNNSNNKHNK